MLLLPLTILNVLVVIAFGLIVISCHGVGSSSIIGITASTLVKRIGNDIDEISGANFPPWLITNGNPTNASYTILCSHISEF